MGLCFSKTLPIKTGRLQMIENDKNEDGLAAGCFGVIMAGMFIIGILMFMGTGA